MSDEIEVRIELTGKIGSGKTAIVDYYIQNYNPAFALTQVKQLPRLEEDCEIWVLKFIEREI